MRLMDAIAVPAKRIREKRFGMNKNIFKPGMWALSDKLSSLGQITKGQPQVVGVKSLV